MLAVASEAAAQSAPEDALAEIREMALYARYSEASEALGGYLERDDLSAAQRNAGLEVLATIHIAMRDQDAAREVLGRLYARDPGYRLSDPDASPPVLSAFGRMRSDPPPPISVVIEHQPPELDERRPPLVSVQLGEGGDAVAELRLRVRQADEQTWSTSVMNVSDGTASARIPLLERPDAYDVQYYVEALAPSGARLASAGSSEAPLTFTVPEASTAVAGIGSDETDVEVTEAGGEDLWWIALIVGAVVVAGGVTAGILIADELGGPQDGSLGNIELPLVRF